MLFLVIVFITAFLIGLTILLASIIKGKVKFSVKNILAGIILGLLNYGSTYYMIMSMATFDSAVVFPVVNVGIVGLSTLIGFFAFKEHLSWVKWLGILLSLTAILLIAYA
jgi:drug/metabolite transporter (DMT)-like permease